MSSHHIVREKQEPALFVQSLEGFDEEWLGQLLEWSPFVVAGRSAYEPLHMLGVKIDAVTADHAVQENVRLIKTQEDELFSVLKFLRDEGYPAVNIIAEAIDAKLILRFAENMNVVCFSGSRKYYPVKSGFSKWLPAGEAMHCFSADETLKTTGLKMTGENSFETEADGLINLHFAADYLLIAENL
ncbi:MAG: thiamine pyrophosphokinase [Mucilaginibacter polytrichastri]|nr:thiamine pyrophosphokinase [Mucilaginibacter polytrichastri]